jgi:hypothetical protein
VIDEPGTVRNDFRDLAYAVVFGGDSDIEDLAVHGLPWRLNCARKARLISAIWTIGRQAGHRS